MTEYIIIPSARLVPPELRVEFGSIPSGMLPLRGRPALEHILQSNVADGRKVVIALHEGAETVTEWLDRHASAAIQLINVGQTPSLGATILKTLDNLSEMPTRLLIHFADTLVDGSLPDDDFVLCRTQYDTFRYTTLAVTQEHQVVITSEPGDDVTEEEAKAVAVGVFGITDVSAFEILLRRELAELSASSIDPFYRALSAYSDEPGVQLKIIEAATWHDLGHLDTYYEAKRSSFLGERSFNSMNVDAGRGVVRKTSRNSAKLLDEISWYLNIPKRLEHVAPRIFDYSLNVKSPWVEMEFYGYPALNDAYLMGQWDLGVWYRVFENLTRLIGEMQSFRYFPTSTDELREACRLMYHDKTVERLDALRTQRPAWLAYYDRETATLGGRSVLGLRGIEESLPDIVEALLVTEVNSFTVVHGDLCLSNLLYDRRSGTVRTIDPRGKFGALKIYGDPRYDLAKLSHSFRGDYDLLVSGRFNIAKSGHDRQLRIQHSDSQKSIKRLFNRWFDRGWGNHETSIHVIEGLLFLSMAPLHQDNPAAQEAFIFRGLDLLDTALSTPGAMNV